MLLDNFFLKNEGVYSYITVNQEFIDYRDRKLAEFGANGRDLKARVMHADCLIIEWELLRNTRAKRPVHLAHDLIIDDIKVDIKVVHGKTFNVTSKKRDWYMNSYKAGQVDAYSFFKYINAPTEPLKVGDVVGFNYIKSQSYKTMISSLSVSKYDGYYSWI